MPKNTKDGIKQSNGKKEITSNESAKTSSSSKGTKTVISLKNSTITKENVTKKATSTLQNKTDTKKTSRSSTKKVASANKKEPSRTTTKKTSTNTKKKNIHFIEYYDLPYRYNQTIVKVLAQTPQMLFVYWDISNEDRLAFQTIYGEDFFSKTRPVLLIHNETMNHTFEIEINDFANSWYIHINNANCTYHVELARRPNLYQDTVKEPYIYITSSNQMDAPNDHILFEKFNSNITYRNVKTGKETIKDFSCLSHFKNMQEIYGIYHLYKEIYKNELFDEIVEGNLPNSSSYSSSHF